MNQSDAEKQFQALRKAGISAIDARDMLAWVQDNESPVPAQETWVPSTEAVLGDWRRTLPEQIMSARVSWYMVIDNQFKRILDATQESA